MLSIFYTEHPRMSTFSWMIKIPIHQNPPKMWQSKSRIGYLLPIWWHLSHSTGKNQSWREQQWRCKQLFCKSQDTQLKQRPQIWCPHLKSLQHFTKNSIFNKADLTAQLPQQVIQDDYTAKGKENKYYLLFHDIQTNTGKEAFPVPYSQSTEIFPIKASHQSSKQTHVATC